MKIFYLLGVLAVTGCITPDMAVNQDINDKVERRRVDMLGLKKNMTKNQVRTLLGTASRRETIEKNGHVYDVWYYLNNLLLTKSCYSYSNYTPLFFENDILIGWGRKFYNALFEKKDTADYTDDRDEWPSDEPFQIMAPPEEGESAVEKAIKETSPASLEKETPKIKEETSTPPEGAVKEPSKPASSSGIPPEETLPSENPDQVNSEPVVEPQTSSSGTTSLPEQTPSSAEPSGKVPGCEKNEDTGKQGYGWWE